MKKIIILFLFVFALSCSKKQDPSNAEIKNNPVLAFTIKIDPERQGVVKGNTLQLTATVLPQNTKNKKITWQSTDPKIVKVNKSGLLTALEVGEATVQAVAKDASQTIGESKIYVTEALVPVEKITLTAEQTEMAKGTTLKLFAEVFPPNATNPKLTWTSSAPNALSVDQNGKLVALQEDAQVIITAQAGGKTAEVKIHTMLFSMANFPMPLKKSEKIVFPTGYEDMIMDDKEIRIPFAVSKTEITYELWKKVFDWATDNMRGDKKYFFQNNGWKGSRKIEKEYPDNPPSEKTYNVWENWRENNEGSVLQPVMNINWRDAIVWANAFTEWTNATKGTNYAPVYLHNGKPIRDARDSNAEICDSVSPNISASGFRLPTSAEWEFAAKWQGSKDLGNSISRRSFLNGKEALFYFTSGKSASGASTYFNDSRLVSGEPAKSANDEVGVFSFFCYFWGGSPAGKWGVTGINTTADVGSKKPNALGVYDMGGNAWEWCFDRKPVTKKEANTSASQNTNATEIENNNERIVRGGGYNRSALRMQMGRVDSANAAQASYDRGLRVVRSLPFAR